MAVSNQTKIDIGIDHEKLSDMRDVEYPNTIRRYGKNSAAADLFTEEEVNAMLKSPSSSTPKTPKEKTQFYDSQMRRI